jgi:F0F1-type ATP synthase membrane subunit a
LLARYVEAEEQLPEHHYELFEEFVTTRATADEERLAAFALTPDELLVRASRLAFAMTDTPNVGLETTLPQAQEMWTDWGGRQVQLLMDALHYSKLGRVSPRVAGEPQTFSFAHRRFQEYFAARYLRQHPPTAPFEELAGDNRWREVLVLLCEVLPIDQLDGIIGISRSVLAAGIDAPSGADEHRQAIEALRFLKDGFHSRLEDVPHDVRILATRFIERQFGIKTVEDRLSSHVEDSPNDVRTLILIIKDHLASETLRNSLVNDPPGDIVALVQRIKGQLADEDRENRSLIEHLEKSPTNTKKLLQLLKNQLAKANILDQKRAVESIILADEQSASALLETALNSESDWVQETALRSCRVLATPSEQILLAIRRRLRRKYFNLELFRDFSLYRVLFSSPAPLAPLLHYTWMLSISGLLTAALSGSFSLFCLMTGDLLLLTLFWGMPLVIYLALVEKAHRDPRTTLLYVLLLLIASPTRWGTKQITEYLFTSMLIVWLIGICLNVFVAYLASNYPATPGDWVLLPFEVVIGIPKRIVRAINTARKRDWKSLICHIPRIVVFIGVAIGVIAGMVYALKTATDAIATCVWSLRCLYDTYHPVVATLSASIELALLMFGLLLIWSFISNLWTTIRDPTFLRYLSLNPSARPVSAIEAVERLRTFKTDSVRVQYIRALSNWLPISSEEWHTLVEEANKHKGAVRDELYKLAELWQDSEMGSR